MIQVVDEREMTAGVDAEIRQALCIAFPKDEAVFSKTRAWHESGPAYTVLLRENGRLVAHVGVVERRMTAGETWLTAGGVQNVFVLPEFRGRGLVDQVMAESMREAKRRGYDCGMLFCVPELEKVYGRCGWRMLGERDVVRVEDGKELPLPGKNIVMYYPLRQTEFPEGVIHLRGNDW